jgi:hypothetical protein
LFLMRLIAVWLLTASIAMAHIGTRLYIHRSILACRVITHSVSLYIHHYNFTTITIVIHNHIQDTA